MIISIKNKKRRNQAGHITFSSNDGITMNVSIRKHKKFFNELQRLLMKHFDLKILSQKKEITNSDLLDELKEEYKNRNKSRTHGSRIGASIKECERYQNDKEFREKCDKGDKSWNERNKEKRSAYCKKYQAELTKFKDHHCEICDKLLDCRTEGDRCRECRFK